MSWLGFPEIPEDRIAQAPAEPRDSAKLLVLERAAGKINHRIFRDLPEYFSPGDALVLNDTRVIPARLVGKKPTGGKISLLLLKRLGPDESGNYSLGAYQGVCSCPIYGAIWRSLVTPRPKPGLKLLFDDGLTATVEEALPEGEWRVRFNRPPDLSRAGRMPLPPYIAREAPRESDKDFYQTVYADKEGAVAAPTAGLHFTPAVLEALKAKGVAIAFITLHVGWGTFRPVAGEVKDHHMLAEEFHVSEEAASAVNAARKAGGAVWACGTTAVRVLETQGKDGEFLPGRGETGLFITPGHNFRMVDKLLTNFHMPRHTPLLLAAAFAGPEPLRQAYEAALKADYRFFSYGDAMAII